MIRDWLARNYYKVIFKVSAREEYKGFVLYSLKNDELFFSHTKKSLDLIERYDSRRFSETRLHLPVIAHVEEGFNYFNRNANAFYVENYFPQDIGFYASAIVHEATHAYLFHKGLDYDSDRERHEIICTNEQNRFLRNLIKANAELSADQKREWIAKNDAMFKGKIKSRWWERDRKKIRISKLKAIFKLSPSK